MVSYNMYDGWKREGKIGGMFRRDEEEYVNMSTVKNLRSVQCTSLPHDNHSPSSSSSAINFSTSSATMQQLPALVIACRKHLSWTSPAGNYAPYRCIFIFIFLSLNLYSAAPYRCICLSCHRDYVSLYICLYLIANKRTLLVRDLQLI